MVIALAGRRIDAQDAKEARFPAERADPVARRIQTRLEQTEATVLGKPNAAYFDAACEALDAEPGMTWMVGDDLETDVVGARGVGMHAVLVRTGKFRPDALDTSWNGAEDAFNTEDFNNFAVSNAARKPKTYRPSITAARMPMTWPSTRRLGMNAAMISV